MLLVFCRLLSLIAAALALASFFFLPWLDVSPNSQYGLSSLSHTLLTGFDLTRNAGPAWLLWLAPVNAVLLFIFALLPYHLLRTHIYARWWETLLIVITLLFVVLLLSALVTMMSFWGLVGLETLYVSNYDGGFWLEAASLILGAIGVGVDIIQAG